METKLLLSTITDLIYAEIRKMIIFQRNVNLTNSDICVILSTIEYVEATENYTTKIEITKKANLYLTIKDVKFASEAMQNVIVEHIYDWICTNPSAYKIYLLSCKPN